MEYKKPEFLLNEELSEGVYAASGAGDGGAGSGSSGSGGARVSEIKVTSPGNEYYKTSGYEVTISNDGSEELTDWSVTLDVVGIATSVTSYDSNFNVSLHGSKITITPGQWGQIPAGGSKTVGFSVSYSSDSITLK